eukprot:snap_masked-scaffold_1-processed-gene-32.30-mRNA-1 protein AED:0.08 eAED:0.09 QI:0/-1/0/1/-1/1/1/0/337
MLGFGKKSAFEKQYGVAPSSLTKLGEGNYGEVYLFVEGEDKSAIKVVKKNKLSSKDEKDNLKREIQVLEHLSATTVRHPHIVNFFEVLEDKKAFYMKLELVEGGELFDRIVQKSSYSEKETCQVIKNVAEALHFCHEQGIVHRDLKPENLLLVSRESDTHVKLADFGFAAFCAEKPLNDGCGTLIYVAPEVLAAREYRTEPDLWSLGVILYVLITGYPPFFSNDQQELSRQIMKGKTKFRSSDWKHVSPEAKELLKVLMTRNQQRRASAEDVLNHQWVVGIDDCSDEASAQMVEELRKFKAQMLFAKAVNGVMAVNQMRDILGGEEIEENEFEEGDE